MIFGNKEIEYVRNNYCDFSSSLVAWLVDQYSRKFHSFAFGGSVGGFSYPPCNRQKSCLAY